MTRIARAGLAVSFVALVSACSSGSTTTPGGGGGTPDLAVVPAVLAVAFDTVPLGSTAARDVVASNVGDGSLVLGTLAAADPLSAPFSIAADGCSGRTLAPGASCTVTLRFSPTELGPREEAFDLPSNDPARPSVALAVAGAGFAVAETGLADPYDANTIARDDGAIRPGAPWPSPRFVATSDTSVLDRLTGLAWAPSGNVMSTRDPTYDADSTVNDGYVTWQHALDYVAKLNAEGYLGHSDWRLPSIKELRSFANHGALHQRSWLETQGFASVKDYGYWSSTSVEFSPSNAWYLWLWSGHVLRAAKAFTNPNVGAAWPVRTAGPLAVLATGQEGCWDTDGATTTCAGSGQDGQTRSGLSVAGARFVTNGDGSVADRATGLAWAPGSDPSVGACAAGPKTWQGALDHVACLDAEAYLGHSDWRLPTLFELESLVSYGAPDVAAWLTSEGFGSVVTGAAWSSTTRADTSARAYAVWFYDGMVTGELKTDQFHLFAVRGGDVKPPAPLAPAALAAAMVGTSRIALSWTDLSTDETGFRIERATDGVTFAVVGSAAANATSFEDGGLPAAATYQYRVRAVRGASVSSPSGGATAATARYAVAAGEGSDGNDGTDAAPFASLTHAVAVATSGDVVKVLPGTYDAANGETFPIVVPAGVALIGDVENGGRGTTETLVRGMGDTGIVYEPGLDFSAAILVGGDGVELAGIAVDGADTSTLAFDLLFGRPSPTEGYSALVRRCSFRGAYGGVVLLNSAGRIEDCWFEGLTAYGLYGSCGGGATVSRNAFRGSLEFAMDVGTGAGGCTLTDNDIRTSGSVAIQTGGGAGLLTVQRNTIVAGSFDSAALNIYGGTSKLRDNTVSVTSGKVILTANAPSLDLGTVAEPGGNVLGAGTAIGLSQEASTAVSAIGNTWSHAPPTCGVDIVVGAGAGSVTYADGASCAAQ